MAMTCEAGNADFREEVMQVSDLDAVVFACGDYEYAGKSGTATVHVPRDVTLGDIEPAMTRLILEARKSEAEMGGKDAA